MPDGDKDLFQGYGGIQDIDRTSEKVCGKERGV